MKKRTKIVSTFTIYPEDHNDTHWWEVGDECVIGASSGVRIAYRDTDRVKGIESDFIDIVASPSELRSIAEAILRKAEEQEKEE
jgi:hypothetical protein